MLFRWQAPEVHVPVQSVCQDVGLPSYVQRPVSFLPFALIVNSTAPASPGPFRVGASFQRPLNFVPLTVPETRPVRAGTSR